MQTDEIHALYVFLDQNVIFVLFLSVSTVFLIHFKNMFATYEWAYGYLEVLHLFELNEKQFDRSVNLYWIYFK